MWFQPLTHWLLTVAMAAQAGGPSLTPPTPPPLPQLVTMRQAVFAIPYRIDRPDDPAQQAVEVQLYVSVDRGARWQFYAKGPTTQPNFPFRAGGDGEFWFAIRTVDRSGHAKPATIPGPGLRVLVDTKPPAVRLTAQTRPDGQITVHVDVDEQYPKINGVTIVCRPSPTDPWQAIPVNPQTITTSAGHQSGEVAFWPKLGATDLLIRAEVTDTAGNTGAAQTRLQRMPAGQRPATNVPSSTGRDPKSEGNRFTPAPTGRTAGGDAYRPNIPQPFAKGTGAEGDRLTIPDKRTANTRTTNTPESKGSVSIAINPAIANQYPSTNRGVVGQPALRGTVPGLPPGERPRWVNSRLFELEYDVDSVGPSGIGRVELWGTQDGGKTWRNFPIGNSRRSPLLVNVDEEGIYGFRVVVTNGAGLGGHPPRSGDLPDLWIGVDLTKPAARIVAAQQGTDAEAGHLIISWQADDRMLAARPISLSFSESRSGPWLPIASGLENTGRYAWPIDNRIPPKVYLRLEVRDEAGNLAVHELTDPIAIDQSRPTIRIRDVRALSDSGVR